jgi:hypothetical protein
MAVGRAAAALLAAAAAAWGSGCSGPSPAAAEKPAPRARAVPPKPARHASLQPAVDAIHAALERTPQDVAAVASGTAQVRAGADGIIDDAPPTLADEDRVRFEGMVAQLRDRAADLEAAAAARDAHAALDRFQQLTTSCVKCHVQFGSARRAEK